MTAKRVAILDLGTNTVILLVAEIQQNKTFTVLHDEARVVRLGEGIHQKQIFIEAAMERTLAALSYFKNTIEKFNCQQIVAVGTAGFRKATNAGDFIRRVREELAIDIEVISGEREAELIFAATRADFDHLPKPLLVLDIGGGSTEFILDADGTQTAVSLPFGSVKLTEMFLPSDPPAPLELSALDNFLTTEIQSLRAQNFQKNPATLVATAGTATTLSALLQNLSVYDPTLVHGSVIEVSALQSLSAKLESLTSAERALLPGLEPKRADVIVAGARILWQVCHEFHLSRLFVSDRGLRYGVLRRYLS